MAINFTQLAILENQDYRKVFRQVVKNRSIGFKELVDSVQLPKDKAREDLRVLINQHLIEEVVSPSNIEDYNAFYVTADGLEASRKAGI